MNVSLCFENDSFVNGGSDPSFWDRLSQLEEAYQEAICAGDSISYYEGLYDVTFSGETSLVDWMYGTTGGPLRDVQKKLMLMIEQSNMLDDQGLRRHYEHEQYASMNNEGFLCLLENKSHVLYVHNVEQLHRIRRYYLCRIDDIGVFVKGVKLCFPNLHFHEDIDKTMCTLYKPLGEVASEIIRHLTALNDSFPQIFKEHRNESLRQVLDIFEAAEQISCTLEGNAKSARARFTFRFNYENEERLPDILVCEPHTKIEGAGNAGDTKYLFDRIYFHQGKDDMREGKVMIAHIGTHL